LRVSQTTSIRKSYTRWCRPLTPHVQIAGEPHTHFECRYSPYHQHSAWYPVTDLLTRTLALDRCATSDDKLRKLEQTLGQTPLTLALRQGDAPGVGGLAHAAPTLWCLGYPAQAVRWSQEALALAQGLAHPYSLAVTRFWAAYLHHRRREAPAAQAQAEALLTLATAQGFSLYVGYGTWLRGWALAIQGQGEAGLAQMHQGLAAILATGQMLAQPRGLVLLAEATGHTGQVAEGLRLLAESLAALEASGHGDLLAEAYRLKGEFLLRQALPDAFQAEACFQQALAVARHQQAKSWELRVALSLSRLWQRQGKRIEARELLVPIYDWFTEGFDTADLQEAKALLTALA